MGRMNFDSGGQAMFECESIIRRNNEVPLRWQPITKIGALPGTSPSRKDGAASRGAGLSFRCRSRPLRRESKLRFTVISSSSSPHEDDIEGLEE
jgi:hypothetical protein